MLSKELGQEIKKIDADQFKRMLTTGTEALEEAKEDINELNVFPVPDGDTGNNMCATLSNPVEEAKGVEDNSVGAIADKLANGALMSARGNSGVILSQLLKGLSQGIGDDKFLTPENLSRGLKRAAEVSYQAVMKPVEGTILTVAKDVGNKAEELIETEKEVDIIELMLEVVKEAEDSVERTKDILDTLKEAGVVDAGGRGYQIFLEGMLKGLVNRRTLNKGLERIHQRREIKPKEVEVEEKAEEEKEEEIEEEALEYGYCTEFVIKEPSLNAEEFRARVSKEGDSLLVIGGQDMIKVHIHTEHPGVVLERGLRYGELKDIKIDNMDEQHHERLEESDFKAAQEKEVTEERVEEKAEENDEEESEEVEVLAVAPGEGLSDIFKGLGASYVVEGGQSMNPSTQDLLEGLEEIKSSQVIILPNNKNIISAAKQAKDVTDKDIEVIPTRTAPQGIAAMIAFNPRKELTEVSEDMKEELETVKTGEVTYAVRDSQINGLEIEEGDILGLAEGDIELVSNDYNQAALELIDKLEEEGDSLITAYAGEDVTEEKKQELKEKLEEEHPEFDVEVHDGKQPLYYYIISVE